jgi:hypothetical protein
MSMTLTLARLEVATLADLRSLPEPERAVRDAFRVDEGDDPQDPWFRLDLGNSWHGLHYLLSGQPWGGEPPLGQAIWGECGSGVDDKVIRYVSAAEAAAIAKALDELPEAELAQRLQAWPAHEQDLYHRSGDWRNPQIRAHYLELTGELRQFYQDVASRGASVVQWCN